MLIKEGKIKGIFEIELEPHEDKRGYFARVYDDKIFRQHEIHRNWVHENQSLSRKKGTIRGFHFQFPPHAETKLVRVISGEMFDVFLDLRKSSPTFGQWGSIILSAKNKKMLYIPQGFAHGICTLVDNSVMLYKVDSYYVPESEGQIKWDDQDLGINWPLEQDFIISDKDSKAKSFKEFCKTYGGLKV